MQRTQGKGFTLVELLVVVAIIGILSTLISVSLSRARERARIVRSTVELRQLALAIQLLYEDTGRWPAHMDDTGCPVTHGSGWSYGPFEEFNCEIATTPYALREHLDLRLPWFGLTGLDPINEHQYPGWSGPYLPLSFPQTDAWGDAYILDGDYVPYLSSLTTVSIMSGGPDRESSTSPSAPDKADDLSIPLCYYDGVVCLDQAFCPCSERP